MGQGEKGVIRIVLDTNVIVSALLFTGEVSKIVDAWKEGAIKPVISQEIFKELTAVLAYPKFSLTEEEIKRLIATEILPYFDIVKETVHIKNICRDKEDDKFISCALSAKADYLISGDKDLCEIGKYKSIKIITVSELLKMIKNKNF